LVNPGLDTNATAYYLLGTTGWGATLGTILAVMLATGTVELRAICPL
jgi:hypothetical protein